MKRLRRPGIAALDPGAAAIIGVAGTFVFAAGTLGAGIKKNVK